MFRLHKTKHSPVKSGERINFKFSHFEALQVPKGWDKLLVSIISMETGKTVAKSSKAAVRNDNCQWKDFVSDSIWIPKDDQSQSSKEVEGFPYKLVISMGSAKSGILGEAEMNMATYMSSSDSFPVSFPLNKCSHGTILQLKIQCLNPRINLRDDGSKSAKEGRDVSSGDPEIKSGDSENTLVKSASSYSSKDLSSHQQDDEKGGGKRAPEEASFNSSSSHHSYNSAESSMEKEKISPPSNLNGVKDKLMATQDSTTSRNGVPRGSPDVGNASQSDDSSHSENISQDDPQEFAAASLKISGSSKNLLEAAEDTIEDLRSEAKHWERNAMKLMLDSEILSRQYSEQSKIQVNLDMELSAACAERDCLQKEVEHLKQLLEKASASEDRAVQENGLANVVKEMENEDLEETAEKQKAEIDSVQGNVDKNQDLILQVQQLQESEKNLCAKVQELENALEGRNQCLQNGSLNHQSVSESRNSVGMESTEGVNENLINEIELLKAKLQELESDCQELTEENLEVLLKLNKIKKSSAENGSLTSSVLEGNNHESQIHEVEEKMSKIEADRHHEIQELRSQKSELEGKVTELNQKLSGERKEVERLEVDLVSKQKEIGNLKTCLTELEEKLCALGNKKGKLEYNVEVVTKESDTATKCLTDLQNDMMVLNGSVSTHVSANKVLERKSSELKDGKRELEVRLSELEQENEELSACMSMLEAQIQNLTDDRKSIALELHDSRSSSVTLQDEIARLRHEMRTQETGARQKLEEINSRWSEDQEELKNLRNTNPNLQASADTLMKNCSSLQNSVRQLRMHNLELQEHCDNLEARLSATRRNFADCSKRVNVLQENICSLVEESTLKERSLTSELDTLVKENDTQNNKIIVLDQMHTEKTVEVENLQQELEDHNRKLSATRDEKERLVSASMKEASDLRKNIAKLETELKTAQIESKVNIEDLMDELASSKQNQEMLKSEMAKMSNLLENYRSCEEKFKTTLNSLERKLTVLECEHQQLTEETTKLNAQLLKMVALENEVLTLRNEKQKLETSLNLKSKEGEELKIEKSSCIKKVSELQKSFTELEDCRHDKFILEERIEKLECSLIENDPLCKQDTELRKELSWIKRSNKQLQQQILQHEEEKQKFKTRTQSLEEELILMKETQRNLKDSNSLNSPNYQHRREGDKLLDDEHSKSKESNAFKVQLKRLTSENRKSRTGSPRKSKGEVEFMAKEKFERTKSSLETELRELQERYLDMSLKYAQVEAQREELVMKLKDNNNGRRWF
ncbi:uncharacterized protein [Euphorbia lathyris]|uniref:uncharacterized protein isoform X2 n=1 Tax=Euphorbia lathyris TaxID=212925 RepID=UPI003313C2A0